MFAQTVVSVMITWVDYYARYLVPYLNDMRVLPSVMPEVYDASVEGHFGIQMSKGKTFG